MSIGTFSFLSLWLFLSLSSQYNTVEPFKIKPHIYFALLFLSSNGSTYEPQCPGNPDVDAPSGLWTLSLKVLCASKSEQGKELGPGSLPWRFICQVVRSDSKEPGCLMNPTSRKICQNTQNVHCRNHGNIAYLFGARLIIFKHMQSVVQ